MEKDRNEREKKCDIRVRDEIYEILCRGKTGVRLPRRPRGLG